MWVGFQIGKLPNLYLHSQFFRDCAENVDFVCNFENVSYLFFLGRGFLCHLLSLQFLIISSWLQFNECVLYLQCRQTLRIVDNPLEKLVQNCNVNCKYEKNGCNWKFSINNMASHLEECNFAPYKCVGNKLKMFRYIFIVFYYFFLIGKKKFGHEFSMRLFLWCVGWSTTNF